MKKKKKKSDTEGREIYIRKKMLGVLYFFIFYIVFFRFANLAASEVCASNI